MPFIISCNHAPPSSPLFPYTTLFRSSEVQQALRTNNVLSAVGATKGSMMLLDLKALTDLNSPEQFENIVLRHQDNTIVRLRDLAEVELVSECYASSTTFIVYVTVLLERQVSNDNISQIDISDIKHVCN